MSETVFNIILKVDLQCCKCKKKIKDTLCKLQCRNEKIRKVEYDDEKNTVTISGPFEPQKLIKKICCMAHKVILDIKIEEVKPPPPAPPPPPPPPPEMVLVPVPVPDPVPVPIPVPVPVPVPVWTPGPVCCCRPRNEPDSGGCRCRSCGCVDGPGCNGPHGGQCYDWPKTSEFICEEQPSTCAIM